MASRSDGSLVEEINYLTDLIQSYQSSAKEPNTRHHNNTKHRWIPKKHSPGHHNNSHNHDKFKQMPPRKPRNRNLVYRPPNSQLHHNLSGFKKKPKKAKETSVLFIKPEEGTDQFKYSKPQSSRSIPSPTPPMSRGMSSSSRSVPSTSAPLRGNSFAVPSSKKTLSVSSSPTNRPSPKRPSSNGQSTSRETSGAATSGGLNVEVKKEPVDEFVSEMPLKRVKHRGRGRGRRGSGKHLRRGSGSFKAKQSGQAQEKFPGRRQLKWQRKSVAAENQPHPSLETARYGPTRYGVSPHSTSSYQTSSHGSLPSKLPSSLGPPSGIPTHAPPSLGSPMFQPRSFPHVQFSNIPHCSTPLQGPNALLSPSLTTTPHQRGFHQHMPTPILRLPPPPCASPSTGAPMAHAPHPLPRTSDPRRKARRNRYKWKRRSSSGTVVPSPPPTHSQPCPKPSHGKGSSKNNKYEWRRRSSSGTNASSLATPTHPRHKSPHGKGSSKNTKYKWKRRSASSSTNATSLAMPTQSHPKLIPHHKGITRKNKYKLRANSLSQTKKIVAKALKLVYKKHYGNKVWVPPQSQCSPSKKADASDDDVVFVRAEYPGLQARNIFRAVVSDQVDTYGTRKVAKPSKLVGYEKKTKRGNKQWIGMGVKPVKPVLHGSRLRMQSRNRKWVRQNALSQEDVRERLVRRTLTRWRPSSVVCIDGGKYSVDPTGKKLKRLSLSSSSFLGSSGLSASVSGYLGTARTSFIKRKMASRVLKKSKAFVWHARMHKKLNKYCVFFNRFGKCNKGKDCHYIHDPARIAVCPRFLKGTCDKAEGQCLLSHEVVKGKMPTCAFFLRGECGRDNCPYLHVSVGKDAKVCPDFVRGFCPRGEQCTLQHRFDCPTFSLTGSCPEGSKCPLLHKKKKLQPIRKKTPWSSDVSTEREPKAFRKVRQRLEATTAGIESKEETKDEECNGGVFGGVGGELDFMPLESDVAPDFIPL